jgi:hypothetical protein
LSEDAFVRAHGQLVGHFAGYCDFAGFGGMLELPVAPLLGHLDPAIIRQQPDDIPNLHSRLLLFLGASVVLGCARYLAMLLRLPQKAG